MFTVNMKGGLRSHVCLTELALAMVCAATTTVRAATITVTNTADSGAGSLREALAGAADGDTIDATGISGSITLTNGELLVTNNLSIVGPGPASLAIDGNFPNTTNRVLHLRKDASNSITVAISGLAITNGHEPIQGGGIFNFQSILTVSNCVISSNSATYIGGGIFSVAGPSGSAKLILVNSILNGNSGGDGGTGGAIYNQGESGGNATLIVVGCTISSNSASLGGGIKNDGSPSGNAMAFITNSTIIGNAGGDGGGLYNDGDGSNVSVVNSTLSFNSAYKGGGIFQNDSFGGGSSMVKLINTTVSGNSSSGFGGGIANGFFGGPGPTLILISSTFSSNSAPRGGSIYNANNNANAVQIGNTILAAGGAGTNIVSFTGTTTSLGYNLCSDDGAGLLTNVTDKLNIDPVLGPLQDNGGPVFTHALLSGSPAIDQGKNLSGDATDARGLPRTFDDPTIANAPGGDGTDIGAFEFFELRITAAENLGSDLRLSFTSLPGKSYEIQGRNDLDLGTWGPIAGSIPGNGGVAQATVTNAFVQPQQFYQIHQLP